MISSLTATKSLLIDSCHAEIGQIEAVVIFFMANGRLIINSRTKDGPISAGALDQSAVEFVFVFVGSSSLFVFHL